MRSRILFVSGHSDDARSLSRMLRPLSLVIDHVKTLQQARTRLERSEYDAILTEASLLDGHWGDALLLARDCPRDVEVVVTDLQADSEFWEDAMNAGAYDLLPQPFYAPEVRRILSGACAHRGKPLVRSAG